MTLPLIIGHRGASVSAPENTLTAFQQAIHCGAAGVELDVRLSADGVPVVIHDWNLKRTGLRSENISELRSTELTRIDVGSWFNKTFPRLANSEYSRQSIPTLEAVFSLFRKPEFERASVYVELKTDKADRTTTALCESVAGLIADLQFTRRVVIVSFNLAALEQVKRIDSSIRTGALFEPRRNAMSGVRGSSLVDKAVAAGANEILLHRLVVTRRLVNQALSKSLAPVVWTVDDPAWVRSRLDYGFHGIITNDPAGLISRLAPTC